MKIKDIRILGGKGMDNDFLSEFKTNYCVYVKLNSCHENQRYTHIMGGKGMDNDYFIRI